MQFTRNLYTTEKDLLQIFKYTYQLLTKAEFNSELTEKHTVYAYATQVFLEIAEKHQINLLEIYEKFQNRKQNMLQRNFPQELQECKTKLKSKEKKTINKKFEYVQDFSKFYCFRKCRRMKDFVENSEKKILGLSNMKKYLSNKEKMSEVSINYCFEERTFLYFLYSNELEMEMHSFSSVERLKTKFNKIARVFQHVQSKFGLFALFFFFENRVNIINCYPIFEDRASSNFLLQSLCCSIEESINLCFGSVNILPLRFFLSWYNFLFKLSYKGLNKFCSPKIQQLLRNCNCPDWDSQQYSENQKLTFITVTLIYADKTWVLSKAQQMNEKLGKINITLQNIFLRIFLDDEMKKGDFQYHLQKIVQLLSLNSNNTQKQYQLIMCIQTSTTVSTYCINHLDTKYRLIFPFLQAICQAYHYLEINNWQRIFHRHFLLRKIIKYGLSQKNILQISEFYIDWFHGLKQKSDYSVFGDIVAIFDILVSALYCYYMFRHNEHLVMRLLKVVMALIPHSSYFTRKVFNNKYYTFLLCLVQLGALRVNKRRKLRLFQRREFLNSQFSLQTINVNNLLLLIEKKNDCKQICHGLNRKIKRWNSNKKQDPNIKQINLELSQYYINIISENQIADVLIEDFMTNSKLRD